MEPVLAVAAIAGSASITAAALAASFQYLGKAREERRLAQLAQIEADTRIAESFAALMAKAHGRGETHLSEGALSIILDGELLGDVRDSLRRALSGQADYSTEARVDRVLDLVTLRTVSVGKADMNAAIQVIAELGLKHPLLTRAARVGIVGRHEFEPVADYRNLVARLQEMESRQAHRGTRQRWSRRRQL
jgi:hypothetical protein